MASVGKGRPDRLTRPPGGSERSERGGMFPVGKGRPDRLTRPPGGSERSERGGMFHPQCTPTSASSGPFSSGTLNHTSSTR